MPVQNITTDSLQQDLIDINNRISETDYADPSRGIMELKAKRIQYQLKKAEDGTAGKCDKCGKPIEPARLKIFPHATTCVSCKGGS